MWTVFPSSDYYEGSVTVGFSTSRPSRLYAHETWSAFRCPLVSLPELTVPSPSERALAHLTPISEYSDGISPGMLRWGYALPQWKLGFVRQTHHTHRTCGATATSLPWPPLSDHARVPFEFPRQVRPCPRGRLCSQPLLSVKGISCASKRRTGSAYRKVKSACSCRFLWKARHATSASLQQALQSIARGGTCRQER